MNNNKETATERSSRIGCYCSVWDKDPEFYPKQNVPEGYCGICKRCKEPGHTRHYPGPVPYTGAWCDSCYKFLGRTWFLRLPILWILVYIPILGILAYLII